MAGGRIRNLEFEIGADQIRARRTGTETGTVVVVTCDVLFVEEVVHVQAEGDVPGERTRDEPFPEPVAGHAAGRGENGRSGALTPADILSAPADDDAIVRT